MFSEVRTAIQNMRRDFQAVQGSLMDPAILVTMTPEAYYQFKREIPAFMLADAEISGDLIQLEGAHVASSTPRDDIPGGFTLELLGHRNRG